ncbi:polyribonucleotide nucleotidyltransferase [Chloropicon primus]|uniref:polyribonucleotide nucleotidyltransferase n=1 Tax=Chloropicon primus TaxID=1764295 RepID=A0A5B8MMK9_9CHLO|nr:polyribonucleotide nucleotidyltransferase [Chloropicon primus]UPR00732.1 polyribonucleotide nucleotidyltransferase [Chloropicon primus]|eukprot:QDZ21521.1 polyribonucleotide nucleotidyltransferase [Chloropicon primus]
MKVVVGGRTGTGKGVRRGGDVRKSYATPCVGGQTTTPRRLLLGAVAARRSSRSTVGVVGSGQRGCRCRSVASEGLGNIPRATQLELEVAGAKGDAAKVVVETGEIGRQAAGAVTVTSGETVVYCTACAEGEPDAFEEGGSTDGQQGGMVPLTVVYSERFSAAGRTAGGYLKRDGRPKDPDVLVSRLVDRPIRPMFQKNWQRDTQVTSWLLSYDGETKPEPLAITAAGVALAISDIPLSAPVAGVRVGMVDGEMVVNPTTSQMAEATLDLLVAGTEEGVLMIEGSADLVASEVVLEAVDVGHKAIRGMCKSISEWAEKVGKPKREVSKVKVDHDSIIATILSEREDELRAALSVPKKQERAEKLTQLKESLRQAYCEGENPLVASLKHYNAVFKQLMSDVVRQMVVQDGVRIDGRGLDDVRPITSRAHVLPRTHGSALFTRGETQAMAVVTLGDEKSAQKMDNVQSTSDNDMKRFYLQYFFPPSSVGETGRVGAPGRRELGHGELAERALSAVIPSLEDFPYTMRVESTITESNGSSSMASVCGGTLALRDAGVPLTTNVAGVAMGLILNQEDGSYVILSDILGNEDALGDMDFKVAGDAENISAVQMDIKVEGITVEIMREALSKAQQARAHILGEMEKCSPPPRNEVSDHAPTIHTIDVDPQFLGMIIGSGGKNVKQLISDFGLTTINCNVDGKPEGTIEIMGTGRAKVLACASHIESMCRVPKEGDVYSQAPVVEILPFGCLVELGPSRQALCHISELANQRIDKVEDVVKEGELLDVKVIEVADGGNKVRVSARHLLPDFVPGKPREGMEGRAGGGGRRGNDRGGGGGRGDGRRRGGNNRDRDRR